MHQVHLSHHQSEILHINENKRKKKQIGSFHACHACNIVRSFSILDLGNHVLLRSPVTPSRTTSPSATLSLSPALVLMLPTIVLGSALLSLATDATG